MLTREEKLETLTQIGIELSHVQDIDILLEKILEQAIKVVNADAGSIYIKEEDELIFRYTRNLTLEKKLPENEKLLYKTFSVPIDETSLAGFTAQTGKILNIDNVYHIENNKPYIFNSWFDQASNYKTQSVLTVPIITVSKEVLGVLQIINAKDNKENIIPFFQEDENFMMHFASIAAVALERTQMMRQVLLRMIKMAQLHDPKETGAHVNRVGAISVELYEIWAQKRNIEEQSINKNKDILRIAAMLHDVGKVGISDAILKKPGKLTDSEYEVMKDHAILGAQLFEDSLSEYDNAAATIAFTHHEKWNGKGYPGHVDIKTGEPLANFKNPDGSVRGKKGKEIPLFGRIVALADVYDALSSVRCYKEAWDEDKVIKTLKKEAGEHFDPELVEILLDHIDLFRSIRERYVE